jgi:hypothetical protein
MSVTAARPAPKRRGGYRLIIILLVVVLIVRHSSGFPPPLRRPNAAATLTVFQPSTGGSRWGAAPDRHHRTVINPGDSIKTRHSKDEPPSSCRTAPPPAWRAAPRSP